MITVPASFGLPANPALGDEPGQMALQITLSLRCPLAEALDRGRAGHDPLAFVARVFG